MDDCRYYSAERFLLRWLLRDPLKDLLDDDILDPSVMVPFDTKVGEVPRKVQVERKKRLFAKQVLEELLVLQGLNIDEINLGNGKDRMPLHWFDNTDYETRLPFRWVKKDLNVPAKAAFSTSQGKCVWKHCEVHDFMECDGTYLVQWGDTRQSSWLPRLYICFKAEDPFLYAKRFAEACKLREQTESAMKYNLYVDNMPTEDIPQLRREQKDRMWRIALNVKEFREGDLDPETFLEEVDISYARVLNKIIFDENLKSKPISCREFTVAIEMECQEKAPQLVPS